MAKEPRYRARALFCGILTARLGRGSASVPDPLELDVLNASVIGDGQYRGKQTGPAVIAPAVRSHHADTVHVDRLGEAWIGEPPRRVGGITTLLEHVSRIIARLDQHRPAAE